MSGLPLRHHTAHPHLPIRGTVSGWTDPHHKGELFAPFSVACLGPSSAAIASGVERHFIPAGGSSETVSGEALPLLQALSRLQCLQRHLCLVVQWLTFFSSEAGGPGACRGARRHISQETGWVLSVGRMGEGLCVGIWPQWMVLRESPFNTQTTR